MAVNPQGCRPAPYARRRPEQSILYRLVQQHLETYLALAREGDGDGRAVPASVEREFRHYLTCGIVAYGFARARRAACGHDFLVAFSCKGRGLCPSCTTRRMADTAAHLVDHVFPPLPVRQWVLAVPKRLRWYLEREPRALSAVLHIFLRVIERHLQQTSRRSGSTPGRPARTTWPVDTVIEIPDGPEIFETSGLWEDFIDARPRPVAPDRDPPRIALPRPRDHDARGLRASARSASGRRGRASERA